MAKKGNGARAKKTKPEATAAQANEAASNIVEGGSGAVRLFAPKGTGNIGVTLPDGRQKTFHPRDDGSLICGREFVPKLMEAGLRYQPFEEKKG